MTQTFLQPKQQHRFNVVFEAPDLSINLDVLTSQTVSVQDMEVDPDGEDVLQFLFHDDADNKTLRALTELTSTDKLFTVFIQQLDAECNILAQWIYDGAVVERFGFQKMDACSAKPVVLFANISYKAWDIVLDKEVLNA